MTHATGTPAQPSTRLPHHARWTLRLGGPEWSASQLGLAAAHALGALAYLVCLDHASGGFDGLFWILAAVPLLTLSWTGSALPLAYWGLMLFGWFTLTPEGSFSWWSLPAAAGVAVGHAAAALGASVPPATQVAPRELLRWTRWTGVAAAAALPVGALAGVLAGHGDVGGPAALVVGVLGLAAAVLLLRTEPPAERD
ncbi:hypothetical protein [Intrasporangium flavum]|uniref:hypothetical protein n=1 Tax=Intrasporangium flavum TaxID=1428657 RepID=UPI00096DC099|nr:hypothetical protein [Intrasporangium flavum]